MAETLIKFIQGSWAWMPFGFVTAIMAIIAFKFGDALLGLLDRAWRIFGR